MPSQTGPQPNDESPILATTIPGRRLTRLNSAAPGAIEPDPPTIEARFAREDLAVGAVDEESACQAGDRAVESRLDGSEYGAVPIPFHDRKQPIVVELPDRREGLREDLAVAAVRAEDEVVGTERKSHSDGGRLLSDREVGRPGVRVGRATVDALRLDLAENGLEFPDRAHVLPDGEELGGRIGGHILVDRPVVRVYRNRREGDGLSRKNALGLKDDRFRHP
jgi:hypothetical protein